MRRLYFSPHAACRFVHNVCLIRIRAQQSYYWEAGLSFPESKWNIQDMSSPQFGMKMTTIRLSDLGPFLRLMEIVMKQDVTQLYHHGPELKKLPKSSQILTNGLILSIQIDKGDESIPDYSFIKIYYSMNPDENKRTIEKINKQHKDSTE